MSPGGPLSFVEILATLLKLVKNVKIKVPITPKNFLRLIKSLYRIGKLGSVKASSKAKHSGCFELTLQENPLKRTLEHSDHAFMREDIQTLW